MEIRDPLHGSIRIDKAEIPIIEGPFFQRLRNIKQLGTSENIFPGATHTRYLHSIGVMHVGTMAFDRLFPSASSSELTRLRETLRLACLLHDIGHAPLSHSTESVMPMLSELRLPSMFKGLGSQNVQATHEDYTIKAIVDSSFVTTFSEVRSKFGVTPEAVAQLIQGRNLDPAYFTVQGQCFFPILHQLVSSELDADRMDYLLRDSYFCGVSYGKYDLDWTMDNLRACPDEEGNILLGISERAISTFDDFLLARYHMFLMVYFHYRAVCLEQLLLKYFKTSNGEYSIPGDIEAYLHHDDHFLTKTLRRSSNKYSKAIMANKIPSKILEIFGPQQMPLLREIEDYLSKNKVEYIRCSSTGRLSKYYHPERQAPQYPLMAYRTRSFGLPAQTFPIEEATDLFKKFGESHAVNRLHVDEELLTPAHQNMIKELIQKHEVKGL